MPKNTPVQFVRASNNLAGLNVEKEEFEDAERLYRDAIGLGVRTFGATHPEVVDLRINFGKLMIRLERFQDAQTELESMVQEFEQTRNRIAQGARM